jgi:hypothetical protein
MPTPAEINALLTTLEQAPELIAPLPREFTEEQIRTRPASDKWSAHEHACHLAAVHSMFFQRLEQFMSEERPTIATYHPPASDEAGGLLELDLDSELERFRADRKTLVARLRGLDHADWDRAADHPQYSVYTLFIMFRHMAMHDHLHGYRMEEILLES